MVKRLAGGLAAAALLLAAAFAAPASARVVVGVGIGVPLYPAYPYYPPYYAYPPPVVYAPPPVVYAPPPVVYSPPPATPTYVQQPEQSWYYCDNPRGYYPYVTDCGSGWRQVPASPQPSR